MFIVDDVISEAVSYLFKRVESTRDSHDQAISSVKVAMRGLSASFGEIIELYRKCEHKLRRLLVASDVEGFWQFFSEMLDTEKLRCFCNESGICYELRIAQDQLFSLPLGADSEAKNVIWAFATQLEAYEIAFIQAIKEYFAKSQELDLVAAANARNADPREVLQILNQCVAGLEQQKSKVDSVLQLIRDKAMRTWC